MLLRVDKARVVQLNVMTAPHLSPRLLLSLVAVVWPAAARYPTECKHGASEPLEDEAAAGAATAVVTAPAAAPDAAAGAFRAVAFPTVALDFPGDPANAVRAHAFPAFTPPREPPLSFATPAGVFPVGADDADPASAAAAAVHAAVAMARSIAGYPPWEAMLA